MPTLHDHCRIRQKRSRSATPCQANPARRRAAGNAAALTAQAVTNSTPSVSELFASGSRAHGDPSDFAALYQDAAGNTVPVTAVASQSVRQLISPGWETTQRANARSGAACRGGRVCRPLPHTGKSITVSYVRSRLAGGLERHGAAAIRDAGLRQSTSTGGCGYRRRWIRGFISRRRRDVLCRAPTPRGMTDADGAEISAAPISRSANRQQWRDGIRSRRWNFSQIGGWLRRYSNVVPFQDRHYLTDHADVGMAECSSGCVRSRRRYIVWTNLFSTW